jgi:hypothetical protein
MMINKKYLIALFFLLIFLSLIFISFHIFKNYIIPKNEKINTNFNDLKYEKILLRKSLIENNQIVITDFYKTKKIDFINLDFTEAPTNEVVKSFYDLDRPLGNIEIVNSSILFITGKGEIFKSTKINNNLFDLKFKKIKSNLNKSNSTNNWENNFVRDFIVDDKKILLVVLDLSEDNENKIYKTRILIDDYNEDKEEFNFKSFFVTDILKKVPKDSVVDLSHTGGRIISIKDEYLISIPDYGDENASFAQDKNKEHGKIISINKYSKASKVYSLGHRNPQGLLFDKQNNIILSSEHGPTGGDEINIITENSNYGWPIASYGYGHDLIKFQNHSKHGFVEPAYNFGLFNCGASQIRKIPPSFLNNNKNSYILSCLSGADEIYGKSFYIFTKKIDTENLLNKVDKIFVDTRIRDFEFHKNTLFFVAESKRAIGIIY